MGMPQRYGERKAPLWMLAVCISTSHSSTLPFGYGNVGVSRFCSRAGCSLFGHLRRSDFLPVGPDLDDEVWERGPESADTDEEDIMAVGIFGGDSDDSEDDLAGNETYNQGEELKDVDFDFL